jgi:hypothetical protein
MRPEWLKCETCLFFIPEDKMPGSYCRRMPKHQATQEDNFCGGWTCRRCLQPWRYSNVEYADLNRIWGWDYFDVLNHYECTERGVHKDPERIK